MIVSGLGSDRSDIPHVSIRDDLKLVASSPDQKFFSQTAALAAFSPDSVKVRLESEPQRKAIIEQIETLLQENTELKSLVKDELFPQDEMVERRRAPLAVVAQRLLLEGLDDEVGRFDKDRFDIARENVDQYFNSYVRGSYLGNGHEDLIKDFDNLVGLLGKLAKTKDFDISQRLFLFKKFGFDDLDVNAPKASDRSFSSLNSESSEAKNFKNLHLSAVRSYIQDYMYEASGEAEADRLFMDTPIGA